MSSIYIPMNIDMKGNVKPGKEKILPRRGVSVPVGQAVGDDVVTQLGAE